jgi:uncharacterized GH25 family protein
MKRIMLVTFMLTLVGASLSAHDVWIEPTTFTPGLGEIVGVRLRVGQDFLGDPMPRDTALVDQFVVEDAGGRKPVIGRHGADPAGLLRVATPGVLVVGYRSHQSTVDQTADKFNQYLKEEGLEAIAALRARRGQTGPVREGYSRCAKSLLVSGAATGDAGDRPLGCRVELVAERNPSAMAAGGELPVRVTYDNRPLAGVLVVAINRQHPFEKLSARSDRNGRVQFRLPRDGAWLIKAVHMVEPPAGAGVDWVSYWASLTFELS